MTKAAKVFDALERLMGVVGISDIHITRDGEHWDVNGFTGDTVAEALEDLFCDYVNTACYLRSAASDALTALGSEFGSKRR